MNNLIDGQKERVVQFLQNISQIKIKPLARASGAADARGVRRATWLACAEVTAWILLFCHPGGRTVIPFSIALHQTRTWTNRVYSLRPKHDAFISVLSSRCSLRLWKMRRMT